MHNKRKYYSKVLLFGEYLIIDGGSALAVPFEEYYGFWDFETKSDALVPFFKYLAALQGVNHQLLKKYEGNVSFSSSIPIGSGLGSSGALSAAAYDVFFDKEENTLNSIKNKLAEIENFFHKQSSGIDPLVSYINLPIISKNKKLEKKDKPQQNNLFLWDSGLERQTSKCVDTYFKKKEKPSFENALIELNTINSKAIESLYSGNDHAFKNTFKQISQFQRDYFLEMIPENVRAFWDLGLNSDKFFLKLSGAGGGGFFLGMGQCPEDHIPLKF